ncbi:MAG: hypothetical protein ACE15B_08755 [Bryobacteraceae bacterium]
MWSDRPIWPQALVRPQEAFPVPETLDWDLFLGPAPARPFHPFYHPFRWRGWYDFGTGALGDMACHSFHVFFRALKLEHPIAVHASVPVILTPALERAESRLAVRGRRAETPETFPACSIVTWEFPRVRMVWYDGGLKPPGQTAKDGILFVGDKGEMLSGFSGGPRATSNKGFAPPPPTLARTEGHYREWIAAAKGAKPPNCNFEFGALLTETALLGVIAQRTGKRLEWDAAAAKFPNDPEATALLSGAYREGWKL